MASAERTKHDPSRYRSQDRGARATASWSLGASSYIGSGLRGHSPYSVSPNGTRQTKEPKIQRLKSIRSLAFALIAILLLAAGTLHGQDVKYNFMPGTDVSKFHTYKWINIEGASHPNQIVDAEIREAIDSQLSSKGLTKTDNEKADLYVGHQIAVDKEKQWNAFGTGGIGWRGGGMATATSSTINVGTLVLDIYDPTTKKLVWTGRATNTIDPSSNQEKNQKHLDKAMEKLLKNYPPKEK